MSTMSGYTKLFSSILASTIWREPNEVRIVWITLLAMSGKNGIAEGSLPGLADFARLPLDVTKAAVARLCAPDEYSRSQEHQGRRIEPVDGGWVILNHAKYRAKLGADERREYLKLKAREYRRRGVNKRKQKYTPSTHAEADTKATPEAEATTHADAQIARALTTTNPHAKSTNLINGADLRRHGSHAWCDHSRGLCVPPSLHDEFQKRGVKSDADMKAWYPTVIDALGQMPVGDDVFDFWRAAFAHWIGLVSVKPRQRAMTKNEEMVASGQRVLARLAKGES